MAQNEDNLVAALAQRCGVLEGDGVAVGIGDDCAVIGQGEAVPTLLKTDCVVEGVHFAPDCPPALVGRKALCRVLSDIAAMAGRPGPFLVTAGLGGVVDARWLEVAYDGIGQAAREFGGTLAGGETTRSAGGGFLSVAMLGRVLPGIDPVLRSGGRPGDSLFVTGELGNSLAGWHLAFRPRLAEAAWLAQTCRPHALMDLSDGLAADLPRLATASGTGYSIERDALPLREGATPAGALCDGEDYELLVAVSPEAAAALPAAWGQHFPGVRLSRIGSLTADSSCDPLGGGFDHLSSQHPA